MVQPDEQSINANIQQKRVVNCHSSHTGFEGIQNTKKKTTEIWKEIKMNENWWK